MKELIAQMAIQVAEQGIAIDEGVTDALKG
jgi:hypothetical protein